MGEQAHEHGIVAAHEPVVEALLEAIGEERREEQLAERQEAHAGARGIVEHRVRNVGDALRVVVAVADAAGLRRRDDERPRHR